MITRDRSTASADGARQGAPTALQGAERVHLLQNLADALDQVCNAHGKALKAVHGARRPAPVTPPGGTVAVPVPPPPLPRMAQELAQQRQARRLELHQPMLAFQHQGWPGWAMAQQLGIDKHTVCRSLRTKTLPECKRRADRGRSLLTPYQAALLERWHAGCRSAVRLFQELQPRGYAGRDVTVARYAQRLRQAQALDPHAGLIQHHHVDPSVIQGHHGGGPACRHGEA